MSVFVFETGGERWSCEADTWQDAIKAVWKPNPPTALGLITSVAENGGEEKYMSSKHLLAEAGYDVSKI